MFQLNTKRKAIKTNSRGVTMAISIFTSMSQNLFNENAPGYYSCNSVSILY